MGVEERKFEPEPPEEVEVIGCGPDSFLDPSYILYVPERKKLRVVTKRAYQERI